MADDTDSDWDSSVLDFSTTPRGPRVIGFNHQPPKDMDAIAETSEHSWAEQGFPKKDSRPSDHAVPVTRSPALQTSDHTKTTPGHPKPNQLQRNSSKNGKSAKEMNGSADIFAVEDQINPPFNFKGMYNKGGDNEDRAPKLSGTGRKGTRYDPAPQGEKSGNESDPDEKILQQVRENFTKSKLSPVRQSQLPRNKVRRESMDGGNNVTTHNQNSNDVGNIGGKNKKPKKGSGNFEQHDSGSQKLIPNDLQLEISQPGVKAVKQVLVEDGGKRYVYRFDHGTMEYYEVDSGEKLGVMPPLADKVERAAKRALEECFGCLRIAVVCLVMFLVELVRFVFGSVFTPLVTGVLEVLGNQLLKPMFVGLYNCCLHPFFALLWNVGTGLKHAVSPALDITREMVSQLAMLCKACRLVEINYVNKKTGHHTEGSYIEEV